jgi:hypothetical protein
VLHRLGFRIVERSRFYKRTRGVVEEFQSIHQEKNRANGGQKIDSVECPHLMAFRLWIQFSSRQPLSTPQFIVVDVAIEQGRIVAIHLREHPAWSAPQEQEKLLQTVITSQTTSAVTPRQEGSEQDHLLNAIEDALNKARQGPSSGL